MDPGLARTWPRSTSSLSIPRSSAPMLSPACPSSSSLRNISTPVPPALFVSARTPTTPPSPPPLTPPPPHPPHPPAAPPRNKNKLPAPPKQCHDPPPQG